MFAVTKKLEISAAHKLEDLPYDSPCRMLHGHNWKLEITCESETLDPAGMVVDFGKLKTAIRKKLDHKNLNEVLKVNPTAENLARWVAWEVEAMTPPRVKCTRVRVRETRDNSAEWRAE